MRGEDRIRTYVAVKQRIYSPPHLTTLAPPLGAITIPTCHANVPEKIIVKLWVFLFWSNSEFSTPSETVLKSTFSFIERKKAHYAEFLNTLVVTIILDNTQSHQNNLVYRNQYKDTETIAE